MQSNEWYYTLDDTSHGPVSEDKMRELILSKQLTAEGNLAWCNQMDEWQKLSELAIFQPSLDLIKRWEAEEKEHLDREQRIFGGTQDTPRSNSFHKALPKETGPKHYLRRVYIWGAVRATIASLLICLFWLWIYTPQNQISIYFIPLPLGILAGLFSGQYFPESNSILFKFMVGCIAASAYLFLKFAKYVVDQGAIFGEDFCAKLLTTSPLEGIHAIASHFTSFDFGAITIAFVTAFAIAIHGCTILAEISAHRNYLE